MCNLTGQDRESVIVHLKHFILFGREVQSEHPINWETEEQTTQLCLGYFFCPFYFLPFLNQVTSEWGVTLFSY